MANEYAPRADLKILLGLSVTTYDTLLDTLLEAASRKIDDYCGRRFYLDATASARYYTAHSFRRVLLDDIATLDDLVIETDELGDGTWTQTWTKAARTGYGFELEPLASDGWPYTSAVAIGSYRWPGHLGAVKVTAEWGWAAVPAPIEAACLTLAQAAWSSTPVASPGVGGVQSLSLEGSDSLTFGNPSAVTAGLAGLIDLVRSDLNPYRKLPSP